MGKGFAVLSSGGKSYLKKINKKIKKSCELSNVTSTKVDPMKLKTGHITRVIAYYNCNHFFAFQFLAQLILVMY